VQTSQFAVHISGVDDETGDPAEVEHFGLDLRAELAEFEYRAGRLGPHRVMRLPARAFELVAALQFIITVVQARTVGAPDGAGDSSVGQRYAERRRRLTVPSCRSRARRPVVASFRLPRREVA
jgi:hypothetical protein